MRQGLYSAPSTPLCHFALPSLKFSTLYPQVHLFVESLRLTLKDGETNRGSGKERKADTLMVATVLKARARGRPGHDRKVRSTACWSLVRAWKPIIRYSACHLELFVF